MDKLFGEMTILNDLDVEIKALLEKSIALCKLQNPDKDTNPVQSLDEYAHFIDWSVKCMPWNIAPQPHGRTLFNAIDQSLNYFYWLIDQPLEELSGQAYYRNTLQYHSTFRAWLIEHTRQWGCFLSSPESWNDGYLNTVIANEEFGVSRGWYEDCSKWKSFNDFFSRRLRDERQRPIFEPNNEAILVSPADSKPQGIWRIDDNHRLENKGARVKSKCYATVHELLSTRSRFADAFAGGLMTHTFLNVNDYHRYHAPIAGVVRELLTIQAQEAVGGYVEYDADSKKYVLVCDEPSWQALETRSLMILETKYGFVAVMPVGMSQVCSCNWLETIQIGDYINKGQEIGYFLFGGSDIVMLFQKGVQLELTVPHAQDGYQHVLQGEAYGVLRKS